MLDELFLTSTDYNALPIVFMVNENTPQAINKNTIPNNLSVYVYGDISPYPTVFIVTTAQYKEWMYRWVMESFYRPFISSQLGVSYSCSCYATKWKTQANQCDQKSTKKQSFKNCIIAATMVEKWRNSSNLFNKTFNFANLKSLIILISLVKENSLIYIDMITLVKLCVGPV